MITNKEKFLHVRSNVRTADGSPKLPESDSLEFGEIAVNYARGAETLSIKNSNEEVITFPNRKITEIKGITGIPSSGNVCVVCEVSGEETLNIGDNMMPGQFLKVIIHNTTGDSVKIRLPDTFPYVVIGGMREYVVRGNGYAHVDVISDTTSIYLTMVEYDQIF